MMGAEKTLLDIISLMSIEPTVLFAGEGINLADSSITDRPWSSVYTSQVEAKDSECFINSYRRVSDISSLADSKAFKLSRVNLPVVRLCGTSTEVADEIVQDQFQLAALERLPELLCNYGHIIFAGDFNTNTIKNFCLKVMELDRKQIILFFGLSIGERKNAYINRLIEDGKAIVFEDNLDIALANIFESLDEYDFTDSITEAKNDLTIYISGKPVTMNSSLDKEVLLNVNAFAQLLSINEVEMSAIFPPSERIQRFASFLQSSTSGFPQWYGYRDNNAFHVYRYFEKELFTRTNKILESAATKERKEKPLMLRGQACSGKTNAICALAYHVFSGKKHPVVYIPESSINFHVSIEKDSNGVLVKKKTSKYEALEMLLRRIEEKTNNSVPALIIWDTACRTRSELRKASDLLFSLREDGRQVQIVCTAYPTQEIAGGDKPSYSFIDVDISLHKDDYDEIELIRNLLIEKGGFQPNDADKYMSQYAASDNFFASLYMFRELHIEMKKRLRRESEGQIDDINSRINELSKDAATEKLNTAMAIQLKKALEKFDWNFSEDLDSKEEERKAEEMKHKLSSIICSIAFCTIYKEKLPVSIMLRMLGDIDISTTKIFDVIVNHSLLISSISPDNEEPTVAVRSELEAKLILEEYCKQRMDIILLLLDNVSLNSSDELRLMQNIIRLIGPNNKNSALSLWRQDNTEFEKLLAKLNELRTDSDCAGLVLQEITLGREILQSCTWLDDSERRERIKELIDLAYEIIEEHSGYEIDGFLANIYVEWAQICIRYSMMDASYSKKVMFDEVERHLRVVINRFPKNGYAYSAYLWAGLHYVKSLDGTDEVKLELLEKLATIKDIVEIEFGDIDFDEKVLAEIDNLLDEFSLSNERFEKSIADGKAYGLYFKVRQIQGEGGEKLDYNLAIGNKAAPRKKCKRIVEFLCNEKHYEIATANPACLYAFINTQWLLLTREPIIPTAENVYIGLPKSKWLELYLLCRKYLDEISIYRAARIIYLLALCAANLDDHRSECQELFDEIRNAEWFERRTLHIICDENKNPLKFNGRISGRYSSEKNRGYINIDAVGVQNAVFFRADKIGLRTSDLKENMQLWDLSLATSFSGFQVCKI